MSTQPEALVPVETPETEAKNENSVLKMAGWFSVGVALAALGLYVGAELRSRSKFKKRTPYDFYANAGESQASEFGVGI